MNNISNKQQLNPSSFNHSLLPFLFKGADLWDDLFPSEESCESHSNISLSEDENNIYVEAALPGVSGDHIDVTLDKGTLWIEGKREEKEEDSRKKYYCKTKKDYSYRIALPEGLDQSVEPRADFDKGMMHISFAKAQKESPKKIHIKNK